MISNDRSLMGGNSSSGTPSDSIFLAVGMLTPTIFAAVVMLSVSQ